VFPTRADHHPDDPSADQLPSFVSRLVGEKLVEFVERQELVIG